MAFIYDPNNEFEKRVNSESVVWQSVESKFWINILQKLIEEHSKETNSGLSNKIIKNFDKEISNFIQVCPKEMLDKLEHPFLIILASKKLAKMKNIEIFCFGFGQVAKHFVNKLGLENFHINLSVTSRNKTQEKILNKMNYVNFKFDGDNYDNKLIEKLKKADYILISIPPKNGKDVVLKNFLNIIENCRAKWITYLSSTSVYGDHKGQWVDEMSLLNPTSYNGIDRLYVEKLWMSLYSNKKIPLQIFRLSGIYSNENNVLIKLRSGNAKIIDKKNHFFSRIHVEDIANIYLHPFRIQSWRNL